MKRKTLLIISLLVFLLVPLGVLAENSQPFAPIDSRKATIEMVKGRYAEIKSMNLKDPRRSEFFRLSLAYTGFTENELDIIVKRNGFKIEPCGSHNISTSEMVPNGGSKLHRKVTPTEDVVSIIIDGTHSIPWLLPRCMNPSKEEPKPAPPEPEIISGCLNECWQSGPTMISYPFAGMGGSTTYVGYGNFGTYASGGDIFSGIVFHTPITCGDVPYTYKQTPGEIK